MPDITIVYWRDIPAQVIVGKGRGAKKLHLGERFEKAIDQCAMHIGAKDDNTYLAEWRKSKPREVVGDAAVIAQSEADRLNSEFHDEQLNILVKNGGWA